jgi:hypothetical protein
MKFFDVERYRRGRVIWKDAEHPAITAMWCVHPLVWFGGWALLGAISWLTCR